MDAISADDEQIRRTLCGRVGCMRWRRGFAKGRSLVVSGAKATASRSRGSPA